MTIHDTQVSQRQADTGAVRKAVRGAAIGNTVEWFDFAVYSVLATHIAPTSSSHPGTTPSHS